MKGYPQKFEHIFNWGRLKQALWRGQKITDQRYNIKASFTGGEDSGNPHSMIEDNHTQIAGNKRWKFSTESAKPWTDTNEVYQEAQFDSNAGKSPAEM